MDPRLGWPDFEVVPLGDYRIFKVVQKRGRSPRTGEPVVFHAIDAADWVQVIPLTADGQLILVEQFRPGAEVASLEFPAGMLDAGEEPRQAALRELAEETGFASAEAHELGVVYPNPAIQSNRLHVWLALACEQTAQRAQDPGEDLQVRVVAPEEIPELIRSGVINHALVVTAWWFYESWRSQRSASRA